MALPPLTTGGEGSTVWIWIRYFRPGFRWPPARPRRPSFSAPARPRSRFSERARTARPQWRACQGARVRGLAPAGAGGWLHPSSSSPFFLCTAPRVSPIPCPPATPAPGAIAARADFLRRCLLRGAWEGRRARLRPLFAHDPRPARQQHPLARAFWAHHRICPLHALWRKGAIYRALSAEPQRILGHSGIQ